MTERRARRRNRKCVRCGNVRELQCYSGNARICNICKLQAKTYGETDIWDWANCLAKSTSMHVGSAHGRLGKYMSSLKPAHLRAILQYQHGCCAISQIKLRLPEPDTIFVTNSTLKEWLEVLMPDEQLRTPVLVRVSSAGDWEPGNVIFIAKFLEPMYTAMDGVYGMKTMAKIICNTELKVPQSDVLTKLIRGKG